MSPPKKYNLKIIRNIFDPILHPGEPDRCKMKTIANIEFAFLHEAITFGNRLAKSMANSKDGNDMYFLKRGFEETLPNGQAYETGFRDYSMCIFPLKDSK